MLCRSVRRYLDRYGEVRPAACERRDRGSRWGRDRFAERAWHVEGQRVAGSLQSYWQPGDHVILSLGGVADEDDAVPTGSLLSMGFEFAQLDIGYRDHWFSPFMDSAMIISTQAQTLPSITLSNYKPITRFGLQYEVFLAEMEHSDQSSSRTISPRVIPDSPACV